MANNFHQKCPELMALLRHAEDSIFFKDMDGRLLARGRLGEVSGSVKQTLSDVFNRMIKLEKIVGEYLTKSSVMNSSEIGRKETLDLREDIIDPILGEFSQEIERGEIQIDNRLGGIPGNKFFCFCQQKLVGHRL